MSVVSRRVFIGMTAASSVGLFTAQAGVKPQLRKPIVFSYDWPVSGTSSIGSQPLPSSFYSIDLDTTSVIEIGPRKLSYPPAKIDKYDSDIYDYWRTKGVLLVRRGTTHRYNALGEKAGFCSYDELVERWSHDLDEPGAGGISIDEFYSHETFFTQYADAHDEMIIDTWTRALKTIRHSYPEKLIFCWMWGLCRRSGPILTAFREYADYFIPEVYYNEKEAAGFPQHTFTRFRETVDFAESLNTGISMKILVGFGFNESLWDTVPGIDYGHFIEAQIKTVGTDTVLKGLPGVAIYKPATLSPKNMKRMNAALKKYILR